MNRYTNCNKSN